MKYNSSLTGCWYAHCCLSQSIIQGYHLIRSVKGCQIHGQHSNKGKPKHCRRRQSKCCQCRKLPCGLVAESRHSPLCILGSRARVVIEISALKEINSNGGEIYCPQSFSRGGLYLNGSWLLWSVYDGLLLSVYDWLLLSVKKGLLWRENDGLLWLCMKGYYEGCIGYFGKWVIRVGANLGCNGRP